MNTSIECIVPSWLCSHRLMLPHGHRATLPPWTLQHLMQEKQLLCCQQQQPPPWNRNLGLQVQAFHQNHYDLVIIMNHYSRMGQVEIPCWNNSTPISKGKGSHFSAVAPPFCKQTFSGCYRRWHSPNMQNITGISMGIVGHLFPVAPPSHWHIFSCC